MLRNKKEVISMWCKHLDGPDTVSQVANVWWPHKFEHREEVHGAVEYLPVNVAQLSDVSLKGAVVGEGVCALLQGGLLRTCVLPLSQHGQVAVGQRQCQPGRCLWRHVAAV